MNKFLAQTNKSPERRTATKEQHQCAGSVTDFIMNESIDRLRCHFGLTPAEARLALHLVAGETLRSAAVELGISYETTRSSLKNIFKKTETCRQAELVIVILTALFDCVEPSVRASKK
jgi:DNA-binding CsgD family transcriptional regulator